MPSTSKLSKKEEVGDWLPCDPHSVSPLQHALSHGVCLQYDEKLCGLLENYEKCFIVHADNVGSKQFMDIRRVSACCVFSESRHALTGRSR